MSKITGKSQGKKLMASDKEVHNYWKDRPARLAKMKDKHFQKQVMQAMIRYAANKTRRRLWK